jgi:hypothetical protein
MINKDNENIIKYVVLLGGAYFLIIKPILLKLGITKTEIEQQATQAIIKQDLSSNVSSPFSGRVYLKAIPVGTQIIGLTVASATSLAKKLRESFTNFGDNEQQVIGIFKNLRTKVQVAMLADQFFKSYNLDLWSFLKNGTPNSDLLSQYYTGLNESDLNIILNIVEKLPKYK